MPVNEDIAIWLGWSHEDEDGDAYCVWFSPDKKRYYHSTELPNWRGDRTLWAEVMEALRNQQYSIHFDVCVDFTRCSISRGHYQFNGEKDDLRLAFWAAFDAWWEAEKRE